ncbi:hypothetical protein GMD88_18575 [Pseudoflavonifractor sp. BIOML-A6]|nr:MULTISPECIES: XF1762 family protein [unclassified Pseudoflavonifractor]KAB4839555.1 hypothetical protein GAG88_26325 [Bacteroides thetaiotaomicron]MTQ98843.1 hypothetical protein [Pseudoflavonifractor sp. BIOML-A16]MTR08072.1 hypothetical protein [Pseudoflavonifractor sp. BIOML-A15]MTR34346.1 hypothetical protein [Pseudoflavonifractor sp. BIOML-A14]MTR75075.1 hypothetical protein [Pseudoflavonifractor sp. BIOML-A18]MTS66232.1 hypothetical protein [Pseudoflavonifractor sp. BIOML-A5]MTS7358
MLVARPIELRDANDFVGQLHRHHDPVHRDKLRVAAYDGDKLVGVAQLARPVSRMLDDGQTVEVVRLCTDGTHNACSFLYGRAARVARELGYSRIITYILDAESGASLRAAGWHKESDTKGGAWDCPSRPRKTTAPTNHKQRWAKVLQQPAPGEGEESD